MLKPCLTESRRCNGEVITNEEVNILFPGTGDKLPEYLLQTGEFIGHSPRYIREVTDEYGKYLVSNAGELYFAMWGKCRWNSRDGRWESYQLTGGFTRDLP